MKHPSAEQILAFDALVAQLLQGERGQQMTMAERRHLTQAPEFIRSRDYHLALVCLVAAHIPVDEARGYFALIFDGQP